MRYFLLLILSIVVIIILIDYYSLKQNHDNTIPYERNVPWEQLIEPGELSAAHAFLDNNCTACHTPIKGVERTNCVICHANETDLIQRQPTTFHTDVTSCSGCHVEHRGWDGNITLMKHQVLVETGLSDLHLNTDPDSEEYQTHELIKNLTKKQLTPSPLLIHPDVSAGEATLRCSTCHANDDQHFSLFGNDCVQCHRMDTWNIAEFRHPSTSSQDCVQCHQAPPSHYMMHFKMISAKVAGEPHAKVEACYVCHQTTSWPDIKRAGWYKHH